MNDKKPLQLLLTPKQYEMLNDLKDKMGMSTYSSIFFRALDDLHQYKFPSYKQKDVTEESEEKIAKRAKAKVQMKEAEAKAKEDIRLQPRIDSCINDFKGRVEDGMCYFTSYQPEEKYDQEESIPLESCFPDIAEARVWLPSRQAVLNKRKDLNLKLRDDTSIKVSKKNMKKLIVASLVLVNVLGFKVFADEVVINRGGAGGMLIEIARQKARAEANSIVEKQLYVWDVVKFGDRNENVKTLQQYLNNKGASLKVDGIYGKLTLKAFNTYK